MNGNKPLRKTGRGLISIICIVVMIGLMFPASVFAAGSEDTEKTVRVGWYQSNMFQEGTSDEEEKWGYSYIYLQKIADYTAWDYEYVYGDWADLLYMLENGEIDVMAGVSSTEDRAGKMLFPNFSMGLDEYYFLKNADDDSISVSDFSTLNGKKAGGFKDNLITVFAQEWCEDNGVDVEFVYFDNFREQEAAFENGEIDLLAQTITNVDGLLNVATLAKVGEYPYYLAVNKNRPDLLDELNIALNNLHSIDPYMVQSLQYESYGANLINRTLSPEEVRWVEDHSTLTVGYLDGYLPYCSSDEQGEATGLMTDVLNGMVSAMGLADKVHIQYVGFSSDKDMLESLHNKTIDVAFPVESNLWNLEQENINASSSVIDGKGALLYKGTYRKDNIKRIAVNGNNKVQKSYSESCYPEAEMVAYPTTSECLDAVLNGEVDGTIISGLRTGYVIGNTKYKSLSFIMMEQSDNKCFGVTNDNSTLLLLLNRGLRMVGMNYGMDNSHKYMDSFYEYGISDFLRDNALWIGLAILVIAGTIVLLLLVNLQKQKQIIREKEKANRAKTRFLFNMSHDIRTPMNAIIGFTNLLEKHQDEPEKRQDCIDKIGGASDVLLSIINNVLEMTRIEQGTVEVNEVAVNLDTFSQNLNAVFKEMMDKKNIRFTLESRHDNKYVYGDPTKVQGIFMNLISNAYKYTNPGGSIHVLSEELPSDKDGYVLIRSTISDTGIGMSEEYLGHLFEEFSRENNTTDAKVEGTGLGMAIVKRFVDILGGTIDVKSQKNVGTTVIVTLPHRLATAEDCPEAEEMQQASHDFDGKRILLAEDNDLNAEIATEILQEAGFSIDRAEDGHICCDMLEKAQAHYYDLVLMDIQMPHMNGYEAAVAIRHMADSKKAGIPIVAMTANAFEEDKKEAMACGMNGHLGKPIDITKLMSVLAEVLNTPN
ncbi:MAG: transporter substrate-binding domain-containing protein [Lachnospiraceae bacterium]|nr:transporter substrate-binding domain-containing protein [Lachnospiraceae bacterium]